MRIAVNCSLYGIVSNIVGSQELICSHLIIPWHNFIHLQDSDTLKSRAQHWCKTDTWLNLASPAKFEIWSKDIF